MALIKVSDLYYAVHKTIREDEVLRELMGFDENTDMVEMATRIQKRMKPQNLAKENLPLITFYKLPGNRGVRNHLEYSTAFDFDVYTNDDVELALDITDRISDLFDDEFLKCYSGTSFKGEYITSSEDNTDLENTYKYFSQILFNLGIEG